MRCARLYSILAFISFAAVAIYSGPALSIEPTEFDLNIDSLPLGQALQEVAKQCGIQIIFFSKTTEGYQAPALRGYFTADEALRQLLDDSKLTYYEINSKTIEIRPLKAVNYVDKTSASSGAVDANAASTSSSVAAGDGSAKKDFFDRFRVAQLAQAKAPSDSSVDAKDDEEQAAKKKSAALDEVVVTGTRQSGMVVAESPAPIQILSAEAIQAASGNPDLMSTLAQIVPSLTMEHFGFDEAGQTLMARLRGLSPNHVLVLVDGKRRHTTANLAVDSGSPYQGGAGVDLNFIPLDAIDHIEVLTDGAAAQYGTDAIAGVINIILKKNSSGVKVDSTAGAYFDGGGITGDVSGNAGFEPLDGSYFNVTAEINNRGHSNRSGIEPQAINELGTYPNSNMTQVPGYPYLNLIEGDAETHTKLVMINSGFQLGGGTEFYATASYGDKHAASYENYRIPERVSYTDPTTGVITYPFLFGFNPEEAIAEADYQVTAGFKGAIAGWNWDVSSSYGLDRVDQYTLDSIGDSYGVTGQLTTPNFYDGLLEASQWTSTIDINRDFDVGLAGPLNVAFGTEARRETYKIGAGIPQSYIDGGASSFAGLTPTDAGSHSRTVGAGYVDLATNPIKGLRVDVAGRFEHYSDFGDTTVGKLTARYDFVPQFAVRGTVSNGFRAPTLAEAYYSATNSGVSGASVTLPPDSAGGKLLGLGDGLQPEKSVNYSVGFVFRPLPAMIMTVDLFQISISNRIVGTGEILGQVNGVPTPAAPFVNAAIEANGNPLDPAVLATGTTGVYVFANGIDTRTQGADFTFDFPVDYGWSHVNYTVGATYNNTVITKLPVAPPQFVGQPFYDLTAISDLTTASPRYVINLGADWTFGKASVNLMEKIYGPSSDYENDDGDGPTGNVVYFKNNIPVTPLTNLDIGYKVHKYLKLDIGAINLFNRYPPLRNSTILSREFKANDSTAATDYPIFSPFGFDGGFYYAKATLSF
jgi:iron complex outermembrane receptor protein